MARLSRTSRRVSDLSFRPQHRTLDLITTESKDEVLVYDELVHHIHHLNASAARVWRLCDGTRPLHELGVDAEMELDAVRLALGLLQDARLLEGEFPPGLRNTQSRRAFMKKVGIASIPAIVSVTAPIAKAAASGGSGTCTPSYDPCSSQEECCSEYCSWTDETNHALGGHCI